MRNLLCLILFLLINHYSFGTAQVGERLIYNGDTIEMNCCPLSSYPNSSILTSQQMFNNKGYVCTACWRNYVGSWIIQNGKLYLLNIRNAFYVFSSVKSLAEYGVSFRVGSEYADLKRLFKGKYINGKVFADWFTGSCFLNKGKIVYNGPYGSESSFEKEIELQLKNGVIISINEYDNSKSRPVNLESYYSKKDKYNGLRNHIDSLINWSIIPKISDSELRVSVRYSSNEKGQIDNVMILRPRRDVFDNEAIRVVKTLQGDVQYFHGQFKRTHWNLQIIFKGATRQKFLKKKP